MFWLAVKIIMIKARAIESSRLVFLGFIISEILALITIRSAKLFAVEFPPAVEFP